MSNNLQWWTEYCGKELSQGDYLKECPVPVLPDTFETSSGSEGIIEIQNTDVIVLTQSCDLANEKAPFVALCPVYTLKEMQSSNPKFREKGKWENVRNGRIEGLHMLAGFSGPEDNTSSLVVDFRQIYSLPFKFLQKEAERIGMRKRLISPYLEHLAQAFARFFMRVGLPSTIKKFD